MQLNAEEQAMLDGEHGEPRRWAMEHMLRVARFFDAPDFVEVTQAHIMADTESLGEAGVAFLESLAAAPAGDRRVRVPTITDPRGIDFCHYRRLKQTDAMATLEQRAIDAFEALGILMTNTCINYQTILPPVRGEHLAFGDTGVVIYSNSVFGAYSNFEGGPSALAAGLTGRTPRYGLHLDQNRRATRRFRVTHQPEQLSDWGALGAIVGARAGSYWEVPVIEGIETTPGSDELKHFGAAMASFGSVPLFHLVGVTPEAPTLEAVCNPADLVAEDIGAAEFEAFFARYGGKGEKVDVVVFSAPQLSLVEIMSIADLLDGRQVHADTTRVGGHYRAGHRQQRGIGMNLAAVEQVGNRHHFDQRQLRRGKNHHVDLFALAAVTRKKFLEIGHADIFRRQLLRVANRVQGRCLGGGADQVKQRHRAEAGHGGAKMLEFVRTGWRFDSLDHR